MKDILFFALNIVGFCMFVSFMTNAKTWKVAVINGLIAIFYLVMATALGGNIATTDVNNPKQVYRVGASDTMYVAPKHGHQGIAVIVTKNAQGRDTLLVRPFVAEHNVQASIK